ncbi:PQQ-binding-like beta-propeller repeat protein [Actinomadura nitritigenes]|uniref:outer membrane protein assembly factor BamB family protein n=1 Tax=Actinomadura nitritigenes TaxID=134602 RepID=UPI003D94CAF6
MEETTTEPVSASRRLRTALLIFGAVVVVVAVGVTVVGLVVGRNDEGRMVGPSGAFPAPLAVPARPHAVRPATTAPNDALVYGGLYLAGLGTSEVRAVDIRTGRSYWRYDRPGSVAESWTLDRAAGRLVTAWSNNDRDQVEMIDVRAGRIVWRQHSIAKLIKNPTGIGGFVHGSVGLFVDPETKVTAVVGRWWTAGLDGGTGRLRWKHRFASGCEALNFRYPGNIGEVSPFDFAGEGPSDTYAQALAGVFAIEESCGSGVGNVVGYVVGYGARTGAERWKISATEAAGGMPSALSRGSRLDPAALGGLYDFDGRLLALGLTLDGDDVTLIDPTSGDIVARRNTLGRLPNTPGNWSEVTYGAGTQVGLCTAARKEVLCADDPKKGKALWRRPMPAGLVPQRPVIIDQGRVYLLAARHASLDWQLIVTDLRTGKTIMHTPLYEGEADLSPEPDETADGVIHTVTDGIILTTGAMRGTVDLQVQQ